MSPKNPFKPSDRPQTNETWAVLVAQLRVWITVENQPAWRPFVVLDLDHGQLTNQDVSQAPPSALAVEAILAKAMNKPARGGGKPRRPAVVRFADPVLAEALAPGLARVGGAGEVGALSELDEGLRQLEDGI